MVCNLYSHPCVNITLLIIHREEANIPETEDEASFHAISQLEDVGEELFWAMVAETKADSEGVPAVATEAWIGLH